MKTRLSYPVAICVVLVLGLGLGTTAQLSGTYTIDPNGTGPTNYPTFAAAIAALGTGVSGPVVFRVASTTFRENLVITPIKGTSATNTVTFVSTGTPAVIDANGANDGLMLYQTTEYVIFDNFVIQGFTRYGLNVYGSSSSSGPGYCRFAHLSVDGPATCPSALNLWYAKNCTIEDSVFAGGGIVGSAWGAERCVIRRCEFDGKGTSNKVLMLRFIPSQDSDNLLENCFLHDCSPTGYGLDGNWGQNGTMFWHNTILVNTSEVAMFLGASGTWNQANSFRNNIVVNTGAGGCIRYGASATTLEGNDLDHNCYWAPNGQVCELENGTTFTRGTLAQWLAFLASTAGQAMIPAGGGTTWDNHSIEANPALTSITSPDDIHLTRSSPCIDRGTTTYIAGPWITYNSAYVVADDLEGTPRPSANVDIGADEIGVSLTGSGSGQPGTSIAFSLLAETDAGLPYQMGSSFGNGPIAIGNRQLGLSLDDLLVLSIQGMPTALFQNYGGWLDAQGQARAKLNILNDPRLKGVRIHTAFVTVNPMARYGIQSISNTWSFTITS
jgi:parallel beta helix pectate lyase-like protein